MTSSHPPKAPLILNVGVIGHRPGKRLNPEEFERVEGDLTHLLNHFKRSIKNIKKDHTDIFNKDDPVINIITAMASGSDQLGAKAALERSMPFQAVLPFFREEYAADFTLGSELDDYNSLLKQANNIFELPGQRDDEPLAYEVAGHYVIAKSDIIITVWDKGPSAGRGGTTELIEHAKKRGIPVIHIHSHQNLEPVILSGIGRELAKDKNLSKTYDQYNKLIKRSVLPTKGSANLKKLDCFFKEKHQRWQPRFSYPLMLMLMLVKKMNISNFYQVSYFSNKDINLENINQHLVDPEATKLEKFCKTPFAFADGLGVRYGQLYRSSYVTNFILAAIAVLLALLGGVLMDKDYKMYFVIAETLIIFLILLNITWNSRRKWHQRCLDYRHLAERLRLSAIWTVLGSSKQSTFTKQNLQASDRSPNWVSWYALSLSKAIGVPTIRLDAKLLETIKGELQDISINQAEYHKKNSEIMEKLDHRLHKFGLALFGITFLACFMYIASYLNEYIYNFVNADWVTLITATLPAFGAAIYGIRVNGDFKKIASQSSHSNKQLTVITNKLKDEKLNYHLLHDFADEMDSIMLEDVSDWRHIFESKEIDL
ncbi:MAG: hypothetical protein JKY19_01675 [Alcanivoracaceae bacterium]|nr:hypothetical protein [Alcanivoracaceae bacterium]